VANVIPQLIPARTFWAIRIKTGSPSSDPFFKGDRSMAASTLSVLPSALSADLVTFLNQHQRFPRLGDALAPWHYRGWLLAYVILIHETCPSVADRWGYHLRTLAGGRLLDEPIPQIVFGTPDTKVISMLHEWCRLTAMFRAFA
jgi:hypothetical protein